MALFRDADPARVRNVMEVNFFRPGRDDPARLAAAGKGSRPIVVNVSSILGIAASPTTARTRRASSPCAASASRSARNGWKEGIDVLVVSPGTTETEFFDRSWSQQGGPSWPEHAPSPPPRSPADGSRNPPRHARDYPYAGQAALLDEPLSPRMVDTVMSWYA